MKKSLLLLTVMLASVLIYALQNADRNEVDPSRSEGVLDTLANERDTLVKRTESAGSKAQGFTCSK